MSFLYSVGVVLHLGMLWCDYIARYTLKFVCVKFFACVVWPLQ